MLHLLWLLWSLLFETATDTDDDEDEDSDTDAPDGADSGDDDEDEDEDEIRDPKAKIKSLRSANARLARKLDKREKRIKELEGGARSSDGLRSAQMEVAFLRAAIETGESIDLDTAWDLANVRGLIDTVDVAKDGTVTGMEDMLARVLERYPWLTEEYIPDDPAPDRTPTPRTDGGLGNKRKGDSNAGGERVALEKRFPALKSRRRRS